MCLKVTDSANERKESKYLIFFCVFNKENKAKKISMVTHVCSCLCTRSLSIQPTRELENKTNKQTKKNTAPVIQISNGL